MLTKTVPSQVEPNSGVFPAAGAAPTPTCRSRPSLGLQKEECRGGERASGCCLHCRVARSDGNVRQVLVDLVKRAVKLVRPEIPALALPGADVRPGRGRCCPVSFLPASGFKEQKSCSSRRVNITYFVCFMWRDS